MPSRVSGRQCDRARPPGGMRRRRDGEALDRWRRRARTSRSVAVLRLHPLFLGPADDRSFAEFRLAEVEPVPGEAAGSSPPRPHRPALGRRAAPARLWRIRREGVGGDDPDTTTEELGDRVRAALGDSAAAVEAVEIAAETPARSCHRRRPNGSASAGAEERAPSRRPPRPDADARRRGGQPAPRRHLRGAPRGDGMDSSPVSTNSVESDRVDY